MIVIATIGALIFAAFKLPFMTAVGSALALLTGTGPLIGVLDGQFTGFSQAETGVLQNAILLMIVGRMEVLLFLVPLFRLLNKKR